LDIPTFLDDYQEILSCRGMSDRIENLQEEVIQTCLQSIIVGHSLSLDGNKMRWKTSTSELQKYNPLNLANFSSALS